MAWRCSASTNEGLVRNLRQANLFQSPRVEAALLAVDRGLFAPQSPYEDAPQTIGFRATISAPHMHAHALELLEPFLKPGMRALDVGCGSGFLTACMAHMVGDTGKVVGVDHIPELIELSRRNVKAHDERLLTDGRIELRCGDGNTEGFGGPFDAIHVGAAAAQLPESVGAAQGDDRKRIWTDAGEDEQLVAQLGRPGRMVIPVGPEGDQALFRVERDADGRVHMERLFGVRYVPLVAAGGRR